LPPSAPLLRLFPAEKMRAYPVSTWVNDVKHQDARCIEPAV
jgi:putative SOS response-associated peptidase YedK